MELGIRETDTPQHDSLIIPQQCRWQRPVCSTGHGASQKDFLSHEYRCIVVSGLLVSRHHTCASLNSVVAPTFLSKYIWVILCIMVAKLSVDLNYL